MAISIDTNAINAWISAFEKSINVYSVTKTTSNNSADETLTYSSTASTKKGAFFKKDAKFIQDKPGLIGASDAVFVAYTSVTLNKNDKLLFDGQYYLVDEPIKRYFGSTHIYNAYQLFMVQ